VVTNDLSFFAASVARQARMTDTVDVAGSHALANLKTCSSFGMD
jgi:hypothetical protein